jgi:hypothetical protein
MEKEKFENKVVEEVNKRLSGMVSKLDVLSQYMFNEYSKVTGDICSFVDIRNEQKAQELGLDSAGVESWLITAIDGFIENEKRKLEKV